MTVKLRYKQPDGETSRLMSVAVRDRDGELTPNLGFASAVAEFGMIARSRQCAVSRTMLARNVSALVTP